MISTEKVVLNDQHRDRLMTHIKDINEFLSKKYPIVTLILSFSVLIFILFLIYLYEDYLFSVGIKLLTIVPLWAIVVINLKYFRNRLPASRLKKLYSKLLEDNSYQAIQVKSNSCDKYADALYNYLVFHMDSGKLLFLRLQDFTVDMDKFPNDDFLIPPYGLLDIVGNEIVCRGNRIEPTHNNGVSRQLIAFRLFEKGQVMVTDKIY